MIRSVLSVTYTLMAPLVPEGTIAALAVTAPVVAFKLEPSGCSCPVGHPVRYPRVGRGTAVKFSESPCALLGMLQELESTGKKRTCPPLRVGPPKGPLGQRVSATRHGVSGKNASVALVAGTK